MKVLKKDTPKLPLPFKRKWVKELRSGKYKQIGGMLNYSDEDGKFGYCCLGVAGRCLGFGDRKLEDGFCLTDLTKVPASITKVMKAETNVLTQGGDIRSVESFLAHCNDDKAWSFKKIANWIEKNL